MAPFCLLQQVFSDTMENCLPSSQVKLVHADTGMYWKIDAETFGSLPLIPEFIITMGKPFSILQPRKDLPVTWLYLSMKIKRVIFGSAPEGEQAVTMGNLFEILQRRKDCPIIILLLSSKTTPVKYGLAQRASF